ncbi:MAG: ATP-binding cassette domain-containing protein [Bryobacterales bacterium]|nr:ATP-binding cassette domain-containing protein [Bryobacterales bacterium]
MALRNVSFSINAGEHVAILGPNGGGKSTLLKTVTRECYPRFPYQSRVRIWGDEVWTLFELRATLGIVTNDLIATCTKPYSAMETVLSAFFGSIGIWPNHHVTPEMEAKAREVLEFFEVLHLADRLMTELSSGEARRVVFARALAHDPKALVLDEPTNSLDIRAQREVRDAMRKLARIGVTVIVVTHHLPDIIPEIERVIALKSGRIFLDGKKEDILTGSKMQELFATPVAVDHAHGFYQMNLAD